MIALAYTALPLLNAALFSRIPRPPMSKIFRRVLDFVLLAVCCVFLLMWCSTRDSDKDEGPETSDVSGVTGDNSQVRNAAGSDLNSAPANDASGAEAGQDEHMPPPTKNDRPNPDANPVGERDPVLDFDFHPDNFEFEGWTEMLLSLQTTMTDALGEVGERHKDVYLHALKDGGEDTARDYVTALCTAGDLSDQGCEGVFHCVSDGVYNFAEDQHLSEAAGECYIDLRMRGHAFLEDQGAVNYFRDP